MFVWIFYVKSVEEYQVEKSGREYPGCEEEYKMKKG